jgi:hypothetical protein
VGLEVEGLDCAFSRRGRRVVLVERSNRESSGTSLEIRVIRTELVLFNKERSPAPSTSSAKRLWEPDSPREANRSRTIFARTGSRTCPSIFAMGWKGPAHQDFGRELEPLGTITPPWWESAAQVPDDRICKSMARAIEAESNR